jgi:hypothetical protein
MLRLRHTTGEVVELPPTARFIELIDEDKKVALLVYRDDKGICHVVRPGDSEAVRYAKLYGATFCPRFIDLDQRLK